MYLANQLKWDQVHYKWNDIKFDAAYQQYLLETYGITSIDGRVLWGYVIEVTVVPGPTVQLNGGPTEDYHRTKQRKKIKLIFIMEDLRKEEVKKPTDKKIKVRYLDNIKNHIEEQLDTKIILKDVQIIKG